MRVIVLAGGKGARLRKVIEDIPKPMSPVLNKPFLEYLLCQLINQGFIDIIISIGYKGDVIKSYFGRGEKWNARITYSYEDTPLGTGGAVKKAVDFVNDENFILINGDSFSELDISGLVEYHKSRNADITLGMVRVDDMGRYGGIDINEKGEVLDFCEKGRVGSGVINGGYYIFKKKVFEGLPYGSYSLENDVLPGFIGNGLYGMINECFFVDIGIPKDYLNLCRKPEELLNAVNKQY